MLTVVMSSAVIDDIWCQLLGHRAGTWNPSNGYVWNRRQCCSELLSRNVIIPLEHFVCIYSFLACIT